MTAAEAYLPVTIRPMGRAQGEQSFVRETTLKVRWPRRAGVLWHDWEALQGPAVDAVLESPWGHVDVAESGGVLLGFAVWDKDRLVMLYVKQAFRGERIGRRLLERKAPPAGLLVTAPTGSFARWAEHHGIKYQVAGR